MHRLLSVLLVLAVFAISVTAAASPATDTVRKGNQKFQGLLAKKVEPGSSDEAKLVTQLTADMRELFDIEGMVQRALVDHWAKMKPSEREEVVTTLRQLIERAYLKQLRANFQYAVSYDGEEKNGDSTVVKTTVKAERKGRPFALGIAYVLAPKDGRLRVYDVITDDVSMLKNYRSQFNRIIAKEGVAGLLGKMRKKLAADEPAGASKTR